MALSTLTHLTVVLSLLAYRAAAQHPTTLPVSLYLTRESCPALEAASTLTACDNYYYTLMELCNPLYGRDNAKYSSCYCGSDLFELESSCIGEMQTCSGPDAGDSYSTDIDQRRSECRSFNGADIVTSALSDGSTPSSTSISSSSGSMSRPNPGTSATRGQASPTASAQSSASRTKPLLDVLRLSVGMMIVAVLV